MAKPQTIVLQSTLSVAQCLQRLTDHTDPQRRAIFSASGYQGTKDVLSQINGNQFQLQKRRYYKNDFAPQFYGSIDAWGNAARIEGTFGPPKWVRKVLWGVLAGTLLCICVPVVLISSPQIAQRHPGQNPAIYAGLAVPVFMILAFAWFLPRFGEWIGRNEKVFLLQFLETTLAARVDESATLTPET